MSDLRITERRALSAQRARTRYLAAMGLPMLLSAGCPQRDQPSEPPPRTPRGQDPTLVAQVIDSGAPEPFRASAPPRGPNTQPPSSPPYNMRDIAPPPPSSATGMCGRTTCVPELATEPFRAAPAPFQRCDLTMPGGGEAIGLGAGLGRFSAFHTADARNSGQAAVCCYLTWRSCGGPMGGRVFRVEETPRTAPTIAEGPTRERSSLVLAPNTEAREALARAWAEDAAFEHGSIASFAQWSLDLMSLGAPLALLSAAHQAAMDEVAHSRDAYAIASAYAGTTLRPGALDLARGARPALTLVGFAVETLLDGCVGESAAVQCAIERLEACEEPVVRAFLARVIEDEERHAALAFRAVAWAVREGGDEVREALSFACEALRAAHTRARTSEREMEPLRPHGMISPSLTRQLSDECVLGVVLPCVSALLDAQRS